MFCKVYPELQEEEEEEEEEEKKNNNNNNNNNKNNFQTSTVDSNACGENIFCL